MTRELLAFHRDVSNLNIPFVETLRGASLGPTVQWPPKTIGNLFLLSLVHSVSKLYIITFKIIEAAVHLETWMKVTAKPALKALIDSRALLGSSRLLDVGGGDG